jgi:hypothetical protein
MEFRRERIIRLRMVDIMSKNSKVTRSQKIVFFKKQGVCKATWIN